ncbi:MAG: SDR family NAD(P)-dependent oxidoreductase [Thermoplasmatota archaeon]
MKILITGASSGIGRATALALAKGNHLLLMARRAGRLHEVATAVEALGGTATCLEGDVRTWSKELDVDVLINNAGLAKGRDPIQGGNLDDWDLMMDTNVKGLLRVTKACLPSIIQRKGHVINLGSVAGRWVYPGGNVYCASKHAVRALSDSMRLDLQGTGVRVTNIEPGLVETEFSLVRFDGDADAADAVYNGYDVLRPEDVAETIAWCLSRPAHVNVQELVLYPTCQASVRDVVKPAEA